MASLDETQTAALEDYLQFLESKHDHFFHCPSCKTCVTPKTYRDHCAQHHDYLDDPLCCVWCGLSNSHSMKKCAEKILDHIDPHYTCRPFDRTPLCAETKQLLFGRSPDPHPRAYEDVWPLPLPPTPLDRPTYDIEPLNRAAACLRVFLDPTKFSAWYSIVVHSDRFPVFLEAMDADRGRTCTLPFWCWCDEAGEEDPHRHMIVASLSEEHFDRNVWQKVIQDPSPEDRRRAPRRERLWYESDLLDELENACGRESYADDDDHRQPHYYIHESLPKDFKLALSMEWEGGPDDFLNRLTIQALVKESEWNPGIFDDQDWTFQATEQTKKFLETVLPLSKDFVPTQRGTPYFLHYVGGKKIYFERLLPLPFYAVSSDEKEEKEPKEKEGVWDEWDECREQLMNEAFKTISLSKVPNN